MRELDGHVDAFGLANIDLHLQTGRRTYTVRDAARLTKGVTRTPIVDGGGLKASWERWMVTEYLPAHGIDVRGQRVLLVSSLDRYALAAAFVEAGADVILGDHDDIARPHRFLGESVLREDPGTAVTTSRATAATRPFGRPSPYCGRSLK